MLLESYGKSNILIRYIQKPGMLYSRNKCSNFLPHKLKIPLIEFKDFISTTIKHDYNGYNTREELELKSKTKVWIKILNSI